MRFPSRLLATIALFLIAPLAAPAADASNISHDGDAVTSLAELNRQAREQVNAVSRIALTTETAESFHGIESIESIAGGRVPNYLRAFSTLPNAVQPLAHLFKTVLFSGAVEPETKMAMGLRIAQIYHSPYPAVHLQRFLRGTERGRTLLRSLESGAADSLKPSQQLALRYAENLTRHVHGVSDEDFREVRGSFNDAQIVELTLTVCFFNHFTRFAEAMNLAVEPWAVDSDFMAPAGSFAPPMARVGLISNEQMEWAAATIASRQEASAQRSGLGLGIANSQRAMFLSPEIAQAWRSFGFGRGDGIVSREIKLHVSFAVSMANGCRYCTLHQVQGLRRLNVSPTKLMQM